MHKDHNVFITGIDDRRKVLLTFLSREDGDSQQMRTCAPMDFGPSNRAKDKSDRYHLWDYDSADGPHTLSLLPSRIVSIAPTEEPFDPTEFVTWDPDWHYPRDWGNLS
jgi:hypothetical protein